MNKHQEIIRAAARLFKAKGYHAATVQDIAKEVGMLKGSLYYHIQSKEQLLMDVLMSAVEVVRGGLSRVLASDWSPEEKLKRAVLFHIQAYLENEEVPVFYNELANLPASLQERINAAIRDYEEIWLAILRDGAAAGIFRNDLPPRIILHSIFGMCNWTYKWFRPGGKLSPAEIGDIFAKIVLEGIKRS